MVPLESPGIVYDERLMEVVAVASWEQQLLPVSSDDISVWHTSGTSCSGGGTGLDPSGSQCAATICSTHYGSRCFAFQHIQHHSEAETL